MCVCMYIVCMCACVCEYVCVRTCVNFCECVHVCVVCACAYDATQHLDSEINSLDFFHR